jgi:hypothetical protein
VVAWAFNQSYYLLLLLRVLAACTQLRVLLAFLAFDDISVLPKESVLAVLDEAAADPDEVCGGRGHG